MVKHHWSVRVLHWVMAVVVIAAFAAVFYRGELDDGDARQFWLDIHRTIGLGTLLLVLLRVAVRGLFGHDQVPSASMPRWIRLGAAVSHFLLYLALFSIPVLGWLLSSAKARHFQIRCPAWLRKTRNSPIGCTGGTWRRPGRCSACWRCMCLGRSTIT